MCWHKSINDQRISWSANKNEYILTHSTTGADNDEMLIVDEVT